MTIRIRVIKLFSLKGRYISNWIVQLKSFNSYQSLFHMVINLLVRHQLPYIITYVKTHIIYPYPVVRVDFNVWCEGALCPEVSVTDVPNP